MSEGDGGAGSRPASTAGGDGGRRAQVSPAVWRSVELAPGAGVLELTDDQRREIVVAARAAAAAGHTPDTLADRTDAPFDLPALAPEVARWSHELAEGRGFLLVRRFPIEELTGPEIELAWIGLGTHLGRPVGQNAAGDRLTSIRDEQLPPGSRVRLYRTREPQDFHTDGADIIGLLCLQPARRGGASRIVSSLAVYNEILARRPDLLEELYQPFHWDRQGEEGPGERPWFTLAPITEVGGVPRLFYIGWYLRDAQRHPDVPRLTPAQLEAMELVEAIANDPTFHLAMDFRPGDIQLLNNGRILHARDGYEDHEDPARRRHLLRLWLAAHRFASVEPGLRAGTGRSPAP